MKNATYTPEAEGFEPLVSPHGRNLGTPRDGKYNPESPISGLGSTEGKRQIGQVGQARRDSRRDSGKKVRVVKKGLMDVSRSMTVHGAALNFAKAWAKWHDHADLTPDHDVIEAASGLLEALGVDMVEGSTGKHRLVRVASK